MLPLPALPYVSPGLLSAFPRKLPGNVPLVFFPSRNLLQPGKTQTGPSIPLPDTVSAFAGFPDSFYVPPAFSSPPDHAGLCPGRKRLPPPTTEPPPESSIQSPEYLLPRKFFCPQFLWAAGFFTFRIFLLRPLQ